MNLSYLHAAGNFPSVERDPNTLKLERDVFGQMAQISNAQNSKPVHGVNSVAFVSVEDALRELLEMGETRLF